MVYNHHVGYGKGPPTSAFDLRSGGLNWHDFHPFVLDKTRTQLPDQVPGDKTALAVSYVSPLTG